MIRNARTYVLVVLAATAAWFVMRLAPAGKPRGTLVLCGGALGFTGGNGEAALALRELAKGMAKGGRAPVLASIHSGAPSLHDAELAWNGEPNEPGYEEIFTGLGFRPFFVPLTWEAYERVAQDPEWVAQVAAADAVFLNGGDQIRHTRSLQRDDGKDSPLLAAAREVLERGGAVIGTSAGTHAQGALMFGGGTSLGAFEDNYVRPLSLADQFSPRPTLDVPDDPEERLGSYGIGLGLFPEALLDSHSAARGRLGRLLVALAAARRDGASAVRVGLGVDENTCLFWDRAKATGTVRGEHGVWAVDVGGATLARKDEKPFHATGVRLSYFGDGDRFALEPAVHLVKTARTPVARGETDALEFSGDLFAPNHTYDALNALAKARPARLLVMAGAFGVTLQWTDSTKVFTGTGDTVTADSLGFEVSKSVP